MGTNGWYDTDTGNTLSILLQTEEYNIIFDAGNGIYKLDRYLPENIKSEAYLFLSHFHLDHITGIHMLCKFYEKLSKLTISGPKDTKKILKTLINRPFTVPIKDLKYEIIINELLENKPDFPFSLKALPLLHADLTLGYRVEINGKIFAFCPDTGYCENAVELAKDADLLVTECSFKSGQYLKEWPHLNPEEAARIAINSRAKKLVLVHFASNRFLTFEEREEAAENAAKLFKNTVAGRDEMRFEI